MELGDSGSVPTEFESWYRREHPRLVVALGALTWDRDAARDAADEGFARALAQWNRVEAMGSPTGWTYRVALNHLRRTMRRRNLEQRLHHRNRQTEPLHDSRDDIWELLNALAPRQRTAVALRYLADLPEADIAQAMGVKRGTVASTLADARRRLAKLLDLSSESEAATDV